MAAVDDVEVDFWRRKAEALEATARECEKELHESQEEVERVQEELEKVTTDLQDLMETNDKLEERLLSDPSGGRLAALQRDLRVGKGAFEQIRFERDSLEAELRATKRSLRNASRRPTPGRIERISPTPGEGGAPNEKDDIEDKPLLRVDAALKVADQFRSGTCFLYGHRVKFESDFASAHRRGGGQFDLTSVDGRLLVGKKVDEVNLKEVHAAERVLKRLVVSRAEGEALEFVGFQDAVETIHARLVSELLSANPGFSSMKDVTQSLKSLSIRLRSSKTGRRLSPQLTAAVRAVDGPPPKQLSAADPRPPRPVGTAPQSPAPGSPATRRPAPRKPNAYTPKLSEKSKILELEEILHVYDRAPSRHQRSDLKLLYSTMRDGISLQTFYKKCAKTSPTMLFIKDAKGHVFGALASAPWRTEKSYYGTGETFMYSVRPHFEAFKWTRANSYFQLGKEEFLALGGGGHFALWIDSDFDHGTSNECKTFGNPCLASGVEFSCVAVEAWGFDLQRRT